MNEKIKDIAKELFAEIENADTLLQVCETIALFRKEMEKHMRGFIKKKSRHTTAGVNRLSF